MKKQGSALVSVIAFFAIFFIFCAFAIDFAIVVTNRYILQNTAETMVLSTINNSEIKAEDFNKMLPMFRTKSIGNLRIERLEIKNSPKSVRLSLSANMPIYFFRIGFREVELKAQSSAIVEPIKLNPDNNFNIDQQIQYTLPIKMFDKKGHELQISQTNEGKYFVYIGLEDNNNDIKWKDISCTSSAPEEKTQYFDLSTQCTNGNYNGDITVAKYIRIIIEDTNPTSNISKVLMTNTAHIIKNRQF